MFTTSNIENNKAIGVQFLDYVTEGKIDEMCEMITPTWTMHGGLPGLPQGPDGIRVLFAHFNNIEQKWTIDDVIADNDKVVVRATNTCIQDSFFGIDASGITQTFTAMFIHKIVDGKIDETWRNANDLARVLQLGVKIGNGASIDNK
jgi:predicted SnoaL-like aldol condensation-catalyzing enzyme